MINLVHKTAMVGYLDAFNAGDLNGILSLFAANAKVYSPTQPEPKNPNDFYPALLERSKGTVFTLKAAFAGEAPNSAAILFDYAKPMPDGSTRHFDCVDVFAFDPSGKIEEMTIIFDTKKLAL